MNIQESIRYRGLFRLFTTNEKNEITKDTGFFPNLIVDQGLDFIGAPTNGNMAYGIPDFTPCCSVGTGNTPPATSDTQLTAWLVGNYDNSGSGCAANNLYVAGPPAYIQGQRSWQFAAGTATGNIAEVGVGCCPSGHPSSSSACPLFSHALVVDSNGNPTIIPVLATEALTVVYILQMYVDLTDTNYSMSLSGTTYTGIFRRCQVASLGNYAIGIGPSYNTGGGRFGVTVFNGSIGSVTGSPSGSSGYSNATASSYTAGTYYMSFSAGFSVNTGNLTGGITAMEWYNGALGNWQGSLSPAIPKTTSYAMTLNWNLSWARYP